MGLFDFVKKNNRQQPNTQPVQSAQPAQPSGGSNYVNLIKRVPNNEAGISLKKSAISLDKSLISLEKKSGFTFEGHRAKVAVAMDYSGSMTSLYASGAVQRILTRLMPLALRFDDNGELDVWIFSNDKDRLESMTIENFDTYVKKEIVAKGYRMGSTYYAPCIRDMLHKYFVEDKDTANYPTFVVFITDGENFDHAETDSVIRESSKQNMFIQFVGIGNERFSYLQKLDDLGGRPVDNTGFIKVADMERLDDEDLFQLLLDQYPDWLKAKNLR